MLVKIMNLCPPRLDHPSVILEEKFRPRFLYILVVRGDLGIGESQTATTPILHVISISFKWHVKCLSGTLYFNEKWLKNSLILNYNVFSKYTILKPFYAISELLSRAFQKTLS